jgi:excisionase family DNA binding protein
LSNWNSSETSMHRRLQFDMRENPASKRPHGSRLTGSDSSNENYTSEAKQTAQQPGTNSRHPLAGSITTVQAAPPLAATRAEESETAERSAFSMELRASPRLKYDFEPLIDSAEAAKLLGNIHVKTLQRYARLGRLPGYQIGGHWYFRASELDAWLQSRINSNCQPADRVDFTQEKLQ